MPGGVAGAQLTAAPYADQFPLFLLTCELGNAPKHLARFPPYQKLIRKPTLPVTGDSILSPFW